MSQVINATEATFEQEVVKSTTPVLVDFWAAWCGPCRALAPVLDELAAEKAETLKVVKVNVDENPNLAAQFRITSIPAMKVFKDGTEVHEIIGAMPKQMLEQQLAAVL